jgi:hypothetical protein
MRIRRLQRKDENDLWYDDAYVYEDENGQVIFCCNLTWESVGRHYYREFKKSGVPIEEVETVLSLDGQIMRWLPIEIIEEDQVESYLEALDEACAIPKSQPIPMPKPIIA